MTPVRISLVGFGTVGRWLVRALDADARRLSARYGLDLLVVAVANARDGFVYDERGLDLPSLARLAAADGSLRDLNGQRRFSTALEGLRATDADILVEVTASPPDTAEPGRSHMLEALERGIPVVTSNKWPVAAGGVELAALARSRGVPFRAESTVMSGTPLLSTLVDGLAGARYEDALADAQASGLAERDPAADVDGDDTVARS